MKIRKNDTVIIIAGKDRGKKGIVEGLNMIKRHSRARRAARQAGIIELEAPMHVSSVMLLCEKCGKPARVGFRFLSDGKKTRICKSCQEVVD
jgi:large subunit ribosomal protein L24